MFSGVCTKDNAIEVGKSALVAGLGALGTCYLAQRCGRIFAGKAFAYALAVEGFRKGGEKYFGGNTRVVKKEEPETKEPATSTEPENGGEKEEPKKGWFR